MRGIKQAKIISGILALLMLSACLMNGCGGRDEPEITAAPESVTLPETTAAPAPVTAVPDETTLPPILTEAPEDTTEPDITTEEMVEDTLPGGEEVSVEPIEIPDDPTDFVKLKEKYPHVIAYLDIPDSELQCAIVCHPTNDAYYLNHSETGAYSAYGALFTEKGYNKSAGFDEPLTIIYGHNMGASVSYANRYFGSLQRKFTDKNWAQYHQTFKLYLPGEVLEYRVCAAVPFTKEHILYYYNPSVPGKFDELMDRVYSCTDPIAFFGDAGRPKGDKPVLILSTCKRNDNTHRFFVIAELESRTPIQ